MPKLGRVATCDAASRVLFDADDGDGDEDDDAAADDDDGDDDDGDDDDGQQWWHLSYERPSLSSLFCSLNVLNRAFRTQTQKDDHVGSFRRSNFLWAPAVLLPSSSPLLLPSPLLLSQVHDPL